MYLCHLVLTLLLLSQTIQADTLYVASASNFRNTLNQLISEYQNSSSHRIKASYASTGKLYTQIIYGAPFHLFLAADKKHPELLEQKNKIISGSRKTYAIGQLALWHRFSKDPHLLQMLKTGSFNKLSIANPKTAPFGSAAMAVLIKHGLYITSKNKLIMGENIGQAFQFVASGNADMGFVALSQLVTSSYGSQGNYWIVEQQDYPPIEQQAVLLANAKNNPVATSFYQFLFSKSSLSTISSHGYN